MKIETDGLSIFGAEVLRQAASERDLRQIQLEESRQTRETNPLVLAERGYISTLPDRIETAARLHVQRFQPLQALLDPLAVGLQEIRDQAFPEARLYYTDYYLFLDSFINYPDIYGRALVLPRVVDGLIVQELAVHAIAAQEFDEAGYVLRYALAVQNHDVGENRSSRLQMRIRNLSADFENITPQKALFEEAAGPCIASNPDMCLMLPKDVKESPLGPLLRLLPPDDNKSDREFISEQLADQLAWHLSFWLK